MNHIPGNSDFKKNKKLVTRTSMTAKYIQVCLYIFFSK